MKNALLTREEFRNCCLKRDGNKCVICGSTKDLSVHHIIERRLFVDGGYYENNGATLCPACHLEAEKTTLSVEQIIEACGIKEKTLPEHVYPEQVYDKWLNPVLPNGSRLMGELFDDESVQKILKEGDVLNLFSKYVKYPRTFHLPWSEGLSDDDKVVRDTTFFNGKDVVVTLKMDGQNYSMYNDFSHARSLSDKKHWSKNWIKNFHSRIAHEIPEDMRLVVENMYAKHSISYNNLKSYCYGTSIWRRLTCLSWDETTEWFSLFGIPTVDILYRGIWDENKIKNIYSPFVNGNECEGYVVRISDSFHYKDFSRSVCKFVRKNHVQTSSHWLFENPEKNKLENESD